ncbi:MAG TPA: permease prefix domain 1-containing protein [Acidimicrobiales bacterium]|nr:permease prefix domain 1-containing protein [Acidimicrobiales bacterium]
MVDVSEPPTTDPIEEYLDRLFTQLRGRAADVRRILAETEGHLRDAVDAGVASGLTSNEAERQALERFGPPSTVARRFAAVEGRVVPAGVLIQMVLAVALIGGIGLVAIGASAGVAGAMEVAAGKSFVAGDPPGVTYTPARCADFLGYFPHAPSCEAAATDHHFDEVISYRAAAGVLGLFVLAGYAVVRRRRPGSVGMLPEGFVATVGATIFGVGGALLVVQGTGMMTTGMDGAGNALSGGIVAVLVAGGFAINLYRTLVLRTSVELHPTDA